MKEEGQDPPKNRKGGGGRKKKARNLLDWVAEGVNERGKDNRRVHNRANGKKGGEARKRTERNPSRKTRPKRSPPRWGFTQKKGNWGEVRHERIRGRTERLMEWGGEKRCGVGTKGR